MLSASNEWPQKYTEGGGDHEQRLSLNKKEKEKMMMIGEGAAGGGIMNKVMERPSQEQIQQQQQPLKCPRCESTNTKFCYYNNYSLTQPRHFCKACKRYWTRGGTLRSVPVGGGCRKNKRVRRPHPHPHSSSTIPTNNNNNNSSSNNPTSSSSPNLSDQPPPNPFNNPHQSLNPSGGAHLLSPFLYGLPTNLPPPPHPHHHSSEPIINGFPFSPYEGSSHMGGLGLGFSSSSAGGILGNGYSSSTHNPTTTSTAKQILQDLISSNSNPSFHGTPTTMSMSSLLASGGLQQQQQKFSFESLFPYELDLQIKGVGSQEGVKLEEGDHHQNPHGQCQIQNGYDHDQIHDHEQDHHQQQPMGESDPSMLWDNNNSNANGNSIGVNWLDPNNYSTIGSSSVPSLI